MACGGKGGTVKANEPSGQSRRPRRRHAEPVAGARDGRRPRRPRGRAGQDRRGRAGRRGGA